MGKVVPVSGARGHVEDVTTVTCGSAQTRAGHRAEQNRGARSRQADRAQVRVTRVNCSPGGRAPYSAAARLLEARKKPGTAVCRSQAPRHETHGRDRRVSRRRAASGRRPLLASRPAQPELPCDAGASQPVVAGTRGGNAPSIAALPTALATPKSKGRRPAAQEAADQRPTDAARVPGITTIAAARTAATSSGWRAPTPRMRGRLGGHGSPRLDAAALMAGRGKLRWLTSTAAIAGTAP
jgi:hypothetical protein